MPPERVLEIMGREVGSAIDPDCYAALHSVLQTSLTRAHEDNVPVARSVPALAEDYSQAAERHDTPRESEERRGPTVEPRFSTSEGEPAYFVSVMLFEQVVVLATHTLKEYGGLLLIVSTSFPSLEVLVKNFPFK